MVRRGEKLSINHRALLAVERALFFFQDKVSSCQVALFCDNTTAVSYLRKLGGTRSSSLNSVAQSILRFCETQNILLLLQFIPGSLNVLADALSRSNQVLGLEWTLCQEVFRDLQKRWSVSLDLFATHLNRQLPNYFSRCLTQKR